MRFKRASLLAAGGALVAAGTTAVAAETLQKMQVAPEVAAERARDPFVELDRIAYEMRARQQAMLRQMAAMQQAAAEAGTTAPGTVALAGNLPAGAQVTYFSSTTDASGCTRTVRYSSDGSGAEPRVERASAGSCDSAAGEAAPVPAAETPAPAPRKLDNHDV